MLDYKQNKQTVQHFLITLVYLIIYNYSYQFITIILLDIIDENKNNCDSLI